MSKISNVRSETPTQAIVKAANGTVNTAPDANGRVWTVKKMGALDRLRLFKVLGPDLSENRMFMGTCALAACVVACDGEDVGQPTSVLKLEALVDRLGDEGLEVVGKAIAEHFGSKDEDDTVESAKN